MGDPITGSVSSVENEQSPGCWYGNTHTQSPCRWFIAERRDLEEEEMKENDEIIESQYKSTRSSNTHVVQRRSIVFLRTKINYWQFHK